MGNLGRIAYDAYRRASNGKSLVSGADIPPFDELPGPIKGAWQMAAAAVQNEMQRSLNQEWSDAQREDFRKIQQDIKERGL